MKSIQPFRVAHIGAGSWSRCVHGPALQRLSAEGLVSLEVICDLQLDRAQKFRDDFGYLEYSNDIRQALANVRPDAIVCTVQPAATAALVHSLMGENIPLFIEKPPGISLEESVSLAASAAASGTFTFVAFNRRNIPSILRLKQWTKANEVRFARAEMLRTNRLEPQFAVETGIHVFDTLRFLLGDPLSMEVRSRLLGIPQVRDYQVRLAYPGSLIAEIALLLNCGLRRERYFLSADGASAEATLSSPYSAETIAAGDRSWKSEASEAQNSTSGDMLIDGGFISQYESFFRALRDELPSPCSLGDVVGSMQIAEAVQSGYCGIIPALTKGQFRKPE